MTPLHKLSYEEINRGMIWLNPPRAGVFTDDEHGVYSNSVRGFGCRKVDFLSDWSLTGPLIEWHGLTLKLANHYDFIGQWEASKNKAITLGDYLCFNENPLRAVCECIISTAQAKAALIAAEIVEDTEIF